MLCTIYTKLPLENNNYRQALFTGAFDLYFYMWVGLITKALWKFPLSQNPLNIFLGTLFTRQDVENQKLKFTQHIVLQTDN